MSGTSILGVLASVGVWDGVPGTSAGGAPLRVEAVSADRGAGHLYGRRVGRVPELSGCQAHLRAGHICGGCQASLSGCCGTVRRPRCQAPLQDWGARHLSRTRCQAHLRQPGGRVPGTSAGWCQAPLRAWLLPGTSAAGTSAARAPLQQLGALAPGSLQTGTSTASFPPSN